MEAKMLIPGEIRSGEAQPAIDRKAEKAAEEASVVAGILIGHALSGGLAGVNLANIEVERGVYGEITGVRIPQPRPSIYDR